MAGNDPFDDDDDIDDIFKEMQRLFEELFNDGGPFDPENGPMGEQEAVTDIRQHDDKLVAVIDAVGFEEDELNVRAASGNLYVTGQNAQGRTLDETIPLPTEATPDDATTRFNNGVLEVEIPLSDSDGILDI